MCKLRDDTMSQAAELTDFRTAVEIEWNKGKTMDLENMSRELPDLGSAAVRGEAVAKIPSMKADPLACIALAVSGALPDAQAADILSAAFAPKPAATASARAADAPSEPSEPLYFVRMTRTDGWREASEAAYWTFSEVNRRILYESRAADALDSQPTEPNSWVSIADRLPEMHVTVALLDENRWMNTGSSDHNVNWHGAGYLCEGGHKYWSVFGESRSQCLDAVTHWMPIPLEPASSQPTDGGVRNG